MFADLHIHSHHSDGTETPAQLVARARSRGVKAMALTDHDSVAGVVEFTDCALEEGLIPIPGVEISTDYDGKRIHILGYFIDCANQALKEFLADFIHLRNNNVREMFDNARRLGLLDYTWDRVLSHHGNKPWLGGSDVLKAMMADGIIQDGAEFEDCYKRCFGQKSPAYVELGVVSAADAVEIILAAGGIPVVAHPKLIGDDGQILRLLAHGLMGLEVFYPAHSPGEVERYKSMCSHHGLLMTGGTDWHGKLTERDVELGDVGVTQELFAKLLSSSKGRSGANV